MTADVGANPTPRVMVLAPNWLGDVVMTCPLLTRLSGCRTVADDRPLQVVLAVRWNAGDAMEGWPDCGGKGGTCDEPPVRR